MLRSLGLGVIWLIIGVSAAVAAENSRFEAIEGGPLDLDDWRGQPVLVVNTASQCAFTKQYDGLQALYDRYRDQGLVVVAVPSDDFRQELSDNAAVKEFCQINFDLDLPMTTITSVKGRNAHPFYRHIKAETGFVPKWNFNKILLDPAGQVVATFGANTRPNSAKMIAAIKPLLTP
ncbi:glutathione peroxidase [Algirhabdus cladophorae]|uniref:glutathione peroxidase n=1 Tax=Algirhabdus cladophorae TaxID=3377108 RepID=UPI003B846588